MARDDAGQEGQVVLDDRQGRSARGHVDHPQAGLPEQQEEEEEPLLVCLCQGPRALSDAIQGDRWDHNDRLAGLVEAHDLPHVGHPSLQEVETRVTVLLGQGAERGPGGQAGRAAHGAARAASMPTTSNVGTGPREPSQRQLAHWSGHCDVLRGCPDPLRDEDLPFLGSGAESRGDVGDGSDRCVVDASFEADQAACGVSLGDPDAECEAVALALPVLGEFLHAPPHGDAEANRPQGRIVHGQRIVEEHHDPVASEPLERAVVAHDEVAKGMVVLAEHLPHLFGLGSLGEGGEPAQVGEHDSDVAAMPLRRSSRPRSSGRTLRPGGTGTVAAVPCARARRPGCRPGPPAPGSTGPARRPAARRCRGSA